MVSSTSICDIKIVLEHGHVGNRLPRLLNVSCCVCNVLLTLLDLHSSSSTAGCWSCGPGPTPVHPEHMGRTGAAPCAVAAARAAESL